MGKNRDFIIQVVTGAICGLIGAYLGVKFLPEMDGFGDFALFLVGLVGGALVHIIFHEFGHLVCGLLSGYKFVSFRAGSIMLIKIRGRYCFRSFSIPGTGGQCLMDPPDMKDGHYPVQMYNMGGGLFNLILAVASVAVYTAWHHPAAGFLLMPSAFWGLFFMATNLIPMKVGGIANDGYNLFSLEKDEIANKAFWQQLRINKLQSDGYRLKEIDEELFDSAFLEVEGNPLIDQIKLFWMQRLLDEKRFDEAAAWGRDLIRSKGLLDLFRYMVEVEMLYLELIGECREDLIRIRYTKELKKYLKMVKGYPSTHRLKYAYAVRFAHSEKMAAKAEKDFRRVVKKYPMVGEIATEKELFWEI